MPMTTRGRIWNIIMTYKLNPIIEKVRSPVVLMLPSEQREYRSGTEAAADTFASNYQIKSISAEESAVVIVMVEAEVLSSTWIGEEQSFF